MSKFTDRLAGGPPTQTAPLPSRPPEGARLAPAAPPPAPRPRDPYPASQGPPGAGKGHPVQEPLGDVLGRAGAPSTGLAPGRHVIEGLVCLSVAGHLLVLPGFQMAYFADAESYLRSHLAPPVEALAAAMAQIEKAPAALRAALIDRAYLDLRKTAEVAELSGERVSEWLDTPAGRTWSLWRQLSESYPGITLAVAHRVVQEATEDLVSRLTDEAVSREVQALAQAGKG